MNAKQNYKWNELTMGTCYYPEHWDKKLWPDDLDRMKKAGISVIRIAEFAWSKVEPEEGVFTYDYFDEFLNLCSENEGNLRNTDSNSSCMADREVSGSVKCIKGRHTSEAWRKTSL